MTANVFQEIAVTVQDIFAGFGSGADCVVRDLVYLHAQPAPTGPELPDDVAAHPWQIPTSGFSDDFTEFERNNENVEMRDALVIIPVLRLRRDAKRALGLENFRPSDEDQIRDVATGRTYRIRQVDTDVPRASWYLKVQA